MNKLKKLKNGLRRIGKNKNIIKVLGEHMDETKYISEVLDDQINWYDTKSQKHQKFFHKSLLLRLTLSLYLILAEYQDQEAFRSFQERHQVVD